MDRVDRSRLRPRLRSDLVRLGGPRDGGYVVPVEAIERTAVLLSLGIKQDWSFEQAFTVAGSGVRVVGVDPSVGPALFARQAATHLVRLIGAALSGNRRQRARDAATLRNSLHYFWFFGVRHRHIRKFVAPSAGPRQVTFDRLMQAVAPPGDHRTFLKMDIEGSEYAIAAAILRHCDSINGMVVEFHRIGKRAAAFNEAIAGLQQHFHIIHVHGNNYRPYDAVHDFPDTVEVTLLNRALMAGPAPDVTCEFPRPGLDYPNLSSRPDHRLNFD